MASNKFGPLAGLLVLVVSCTPPAYSLDVTKVCRELPLQRESNPLTFTSPKEVMGVIEQFEKDKLAGSCPEKFTDAFARLKLVLDEEQVLKDICGREAYERIRSFHRDFIHHYLPEMTVEQLEVAGRKPPQLKPIPRALRDFFINFATQVKDDCQEQLVERIKSNRIPFDLGKDNDFALIKIYEYRSRALCFAKKMEEYDKRFKVQRKIYELEIVDKPQVGSLGMGLDNATILYVESQFNRQLSHIKEACLKRFRPVYMELFAPVIKLNNLGYMESVLKQMKPQDEALERAETQRWFTIIQVCEVLKDIGILHGSTDKQPAVKYTDNINKLPFYAGVATLGSDVKLLLGPEGSQLEESIETPTRKAQIEHEPLKFKQRMLVTDAGALQSRVEVFYECLKEATGAKVKKLKEVESRIEHDLMVTLFKKKKIAKPNPEQEVMLKHLGAFVQRHRIMVTGLSVCMGLIFMSRCFLAR